MVELVCDLDPSPRAVMSDPGQIHQVLVNLTLNARDAMPRGGTLRITTRTVEIGEIRPAAMPDVEPGAYVVLDVGDTGTGIPEDVRVRIFEPFFTTKKGSGTGLGLASVYGIVRQSGGYISVDSTLEKGATSHILLPALPAPR
jgi:signal transduction histidine kinase